VSKSFDRFQALNELNLTVKKGSIYGLVGTNGSGKTTIIKHITGILKQDEGNITIDGEDVFDNISLKKRMGFIPDDLYFFATYNLNEMSKFYKELYPDWNNERFLNMVSLFGLDSKRKLSKFSKGMQKQAAFILTMSAMPEYLILDEPIDGLDPIVRKLVWKYIVEDVAEREMSVLISSHNLRELEGICDSIGILSTGAMMIERDLDELKSDIHKVQIAFRETERPENPYAGLNVLHSEKRGSVDLLIIRNRKDVVENIMAQSQPVVFDMLPLSLEEIFIYELGGENNEINSIIF
jgi:ABC-2 type transport system ATP-binding protein